MLFAMGAGLAVAGSSYSADEPADKTDAQSCWDQAMTQSAMNACAAEDMKAADERLTQSYDAVMCYLEPAEKAQLETAQKAWMTFRDANCEFWGGGGGSIAPMNQMVCVASLSNQRADELDRWPPNVNRHDFGPCSESDSPSH
jgi:uncharacterized protein YecT (DUF1311 family)